MLKIVFFGTSSGVPTRSRGLPAIFVIYKGERILFDCGEGTQRQLMMKNLKFMKINHIFISHWHADHFAGLIGLIQTMSLENRKEPLYIYGPRRSKEFVDRFVHTGYFDSKVNIITKEMTDNQIIDLGDHTITSFRTEHRIPSLGYVFEEKPRLKANMDKAKKYGLSTSPLIGKLKAGQTIEYKGKKIKPSYILEDVKGRKVVYTGDTSPIENTVKFSKDADLLIHDSTFASDKEDLDCFTHTMSKEAAKIAKKAKVKHLVLTHISRRYQESNNNEKIILEEARKHFKNTDLAKDFMEIIIK